VQWNPILQIPIGIIRVIGWPQKRSREFIVITYMLLPGQQIGLLNPRVLAGPDLHHMSNNAIMKLTEEIDIIAEIEPNQKEHIILALRKSGKNVVGYMGDGINYASALHSADAGISVDV
jgi:magnesium-transporting ATPase (P-type)